MATYSAPRYSLTVKLTAQATGKSTSRTINAINLDKVHKTELDSFGYSATQVEAFKNLYKNTAYGMTAVAGDYVSANYLLED